MNENDFIKLFTYIVTSARGCIDQPKIYGSFRLVDTASKLFYVLKSNNAISNDKISKIIDKIDEKKYSCMTDEEEFVNMIDEVINDLVVLVQSENKLNQV